MYIMAPAAVQSSHGRRSESGASRYRFPWTIGWYQAAESIRWGLARMHPQSAPTALPHT